MIIQLYYRRKLHNSELHLIRQSDTNHARQCNADSDEQYSQIAGALIIVLFF